MTTFTMDEFLNQLTTTAAQRRPPLPAGEDFVGIIGTPKGGDGQKDGRTYRYFDWPIAIDLTQYPAQQQKLHMNSLTVQHRTYIDVLDDGKTLDWSAGANRGLRDMREATGKNVDGQQFSVAHLVGQPIRVRITHRTDDTTGDVFERVQRVAKV